MDHSHGNVWLLLGKTLMRASQERLTLMTKGFSDDQQKVASDMGMQSLMNVVCSNLVNPLCDWLGKIYDHVSREFVILGRGRLPLDEESVFCTSGTHNDIEQELFPHLFPHDVTMPNKTMLATLLENMKTHDDVFKMNLLMYLISSIFAPTTSLCPSNKCFPILARLDNVKNMNWCKLIADFLYDALSNKMYQKGCRLHLMLMYVDRLDLSTVDLAAVGGVPPPHKFVVSAWTYDVVKVVLAAEMITHIKYGKLQDRAPMEHLVGQFASGMTSLLGKLVEGSTTLAGSDADEVARHFTSFVGARTHHLMSCRGRYNYNNSREHPDTQEDTFVGGLGAMDVGPAKGHDGHDVMENVQHGSDQLKSREFPIGDNNGKAQDVVNASKGGNASTVAIDMSVSP
ncbi:hypothetical protein ZWY2020_020069 [Hordeum vulgare]|nr:hypothetical protein ZWY2020_020069 [Hordeum vulgare]